MVFAVLPRNPDSNQRSSMANTKEIRKNHKKCPKQKTLKPPRNLTNNKKTLQVFFTLLNWTRAFNNSVLREEVNIQPWWKIYMKFYCLFWFLGLFCFCAHDKNNEKKICLLYKISSCIMKTINNSNPYYYHTNGLC